MTEQSNHIDPRSSSPAEDEAVEWLLYGQREGKPRPRSMELRKPIEPRMAEVIQLGKVATQTEIAA